jgi:hypothetical protein
MIESVTDSKKPDYLEVDEAIPGQNYVCLSFISPESLIKNKDAFKCVKFLQSYCKEQKLNFEDVYSKYQDFVYKYEDKLQRDFDEQNDFQTSIRGLKVRGVYDTREAAEDRAKRLSVKDSAFHTFVGQVGYWLPWDPNADKVESEIFQNSQLNDMMEQYQANNINRDMFYEEQKRDKIKAAQGEVLKAKEEAQKELENKDVSEEYPIDDDPVAEETKVSVDTETSGDLDESVEVKKGSEVSADIKDSLESDDPWMKQKLEKTE